MCELEKEGLRLELVEDEKQIRSLKKELEVMRDLYEAQKHRNDLLFDMYKVFKKVAIDRVESKEKCVTEQQYNELIKLINTVELGLRIE